MLYILPSIITSFSRFFQILCFITEALGLHIRKVGKCSTKNLPIILGVLVVAEWKQIQLGIKRLWVRSLASLSELRIQHCRELWCRLQTQLGTCVAVALA